MAEPDHIFVNPLPNLAAGGSPAAFPFFYITPQKFENIVRKYYPVEMGPVTNIDPIGSSPVIISKESLEKIAPTWMNVSLTMKHDPDTDKEFGWVLEMYGYAIASALHGVRHMLRRDLMLQPPWDMSTKAMFIIHYTYACDYNIKGELTYGKRGEWRFDKRLYLRGPPPRNISMPPPGVPESVGYLVLNRPWAYVQWLERATIKEDYVLMAEPDHIFVNPLPNLAAGGSPAAFPFFYITPQKFENIVRKYYPVEMGPVTNIDPIGSSPVIISKESLEKIAPTWMNVSLTMKHDPDTDKAFGWVLEMYGYAIASALHGVRHMLRRDLMVQPPWDLSTKAMFIIHYTYACDYNMKGELTYGKTGEWRFDKRLHLRGPPPRNISMPPHGVPESVVTLVKMLNEATSNIPNWDAL
ncbi:hypothetical protein F2Q68_00007294 [Brassica cretica]|uniref:Hydroxyproline O-arabinosyltransferase-like domain-containing protein n=1 Tax=Brassica cretica TaxID=69181 RepID=A0A8S9L2M8_BRACR|nr:hypothetical protein F2Q68_00007294 [Brassica cretica]